jgi:shikimate kinase
MKIKRIFVTGFRATGKTTFAKLLSQKLNWRLIEMDDVIIKESGKSVYELTEGRGDWSVFRRLEHEILKKIINENNIVVSTGGGLAANDILTPKGVKTYGEINFDLINNKEASFVVLLDAPEEIIAQRIKQRELSREYSRPMLGSKNAKKIHKMMKDPNSKKDEIIELLIEDSLEAYRKRKKLYKKLADVILDTSKLSEANALEKVLQYL